jgi:hypothetical protein
MYTNIRAHYYYYWHRLAPAITFDAPEQSAQNLTGIYPKQSCDII